MAKLPSNEGPGQWRVILPLATSIQECIIDYEDMYDRLRLTLDLKRLSIAMAEERSSQKYSPQSSVHWEKCFPKETSFLRLKFEENENGLPLCSCHGWFQMYTGGFKKCSSLEYFSM